MTEFLRDLRSNGLLVLIKICLITLVLLMVYNVSTFLQSTSSALNRNFSDISDRDLYSITDVLSDPTDFSKFRESKSGLDSLAIFYNELNKNRRIDFLSAFDQPLTVANFGGGDVFAEGYGTEFGPRPKYVDSASGAEVRDVKAMQMNRNTFDFYRLSVDEGVEPDWSLVDYKSTIPVLLGSDYRGVYRVGDMLTVNYYSAPFSLEIVGILSADASMYYKGEMNTFLDDRIIVPYPNHLGPVSNENMYFRGILYFAMVSGDIVVSKDYSASDVLNVIGSAARESGFDRYTLLNMPTYLAQFQFMRELIARNGVVLGLLGILIITCSSVINVSITLLLAKRRSRVSTLRWIQGEQIGSILKHNSFQVVVEYLTAGIILGYIVSRIPNWHFYAFAMAIGFLVIAFLFDTLLQNREISQMVTTLRGYGEGT